MEFKGREFLIRSVQRELGLLDDGVDGPVTWKAIVKKLCIEPQLNNTPKLSKKVTDLIIQFESGGEIYYKTKLSRPNWPKYASGVTIGIGYDLGYKTIEEFKRDWSYFFSAEEFLRLCKCIGIRGTKAKHYAREVSDIHIPFEEALKVFTERTIPKNIALTIKAFPDSEKLHEDAFGALVSLVFNRGTKMTGNSRREMRNIRDLVLKKDYEGIAREIKSMKRLWEGKGLDGLLKRRDQEAELILGSV